MTLATGIDPEIRAFAERLAAAWHAHPPLADLAPAAAREVAEQVRAPWRDGGPAMADVVERDVMTQAGPMRIRRYRPIDAEPGVVMVYLHGGGFTMFSIDTHDRLMREYAAAAGVTVFGLDYALAPEHRFPVALDQVVAFVAELAADREVGWIALGGDSAGANLALSAAIAMRDAGRPDAVAALLLNYGAFGPHHSDAAEEQWGGDEAILNRSEMEEFWNGYLPPSTSRTDPAVDLLRADLGSLPPALLVVAECDILAEQSLALAKRLGSRGKLRLYRGAVHSFLEAMSISSLARRAIVESAEWLRAQFADSGPAQR